MLDAVHILFDRTIGRATQHVEVESNKRSLHIVATLDDAASAIKGALNPNQVIDSPSPNQMIDEMVDDE